MNEILAIALVAAFFMAFGLLSRGRSQPSCHACGHETGSDACASCAVAGNPPNGPPDHRTVGKTKH